MSLDFDPTEQRIAAALTRIAEAHVPRVTTTAPPTVGERGDRRRWLAFAVAAGLVVLLVGGLVAISGRDDATTPVDDPTTPPTTPVPNPSPDDRIAVLDEAANRGTGQIAGSIDRFLAPDRVSPAEWSFVRQRSDEGVTDTITLTLDPNGLVLPSCCEEMPITVDDRLGQRWTDEANGDVVVVIPHPRVHIVMRSTADSADDAIDWLDDHLNQLIDGWASGKRPLPVVDGPDGFDAVLPLVSSEPVWYGPTIVTTERYASAIDVDDIIAARWPAAPTTTVGRAVLIDTTRPVLVWQPEPSVVVTVEDMDPGLLEPHLRMVEPGAAGLVPAPVTGLGRLLESELTRVALIETEFGRFAYAEAPSDQGLCRAWASKFGRGTSCMTEQEEATSLRDPDVSCPSGFGGDGGSYVLALVFGRSDARIDVQRDGALLSPAIARGVASDGSPYTIALYKDTGDPASLPAVTVTVDGAVCFSGVGGVED